MRLAKRESLIRWMLQSRACHFVTVAFVLLLFFYELTHRRTPSVVIRTQLETPETEIQRTPTWPPTPPTKLCETYNCTDGRVRRDALVEYWQRRQTEQYEKATCEYPIKVLPIGQDFYGDSAVDQHQASSIHVQLITPVLGEQDYVPLMHPRQKRAVFSSEFGVSRFAHSPWGLDHTDILGCINFEPADVNKFNNHPGKAAALYISNCEAYPRDQYMRELMQHIGLDSYSSCYRTPGSGLQSQDRHWREKVRVGNEYPFWLAFENFIEDDWVTEKFWEAWQTNSLMVYIGAENVLDYSPGENSFIVGNNFAGPKELAKYLRYLESNVTAYKEYFKWKTPEAVPSKHYMNAARYNTELLGEESFLCRICKKYAERYCENTL
eukprot:TRINITY_DN6227_c0_g1_i1.p1 TRINITY_DN6227_c0_g1~~TRINITY_DN6227_c0_g1_i1.p1  ORF type:complete len:380 (+),score=48.41 TRINITY_DN6227_c0_g1_i1:205-1344(+)